MALIDKVKLNLRIASKVYDTDEVQPLIDACMADLENVGIVIADKQNPDSLIFRAIIFYCKAYFGFDDKADRYEKAYERLKRTLCLSEHYTAKMEDSGNV